jgi:hypothetical protein
MKKKMKQQMSDTQVDFEFMAHRRGLSIDKTENAYEDGQTAMLWDWWQTAQSNEPRLLLMEWNTRLEESKKWKGKLDVILKACAAVLDEEFTDTSWEQQFMTNEQSPDVVEHRKLSVKRNILRGVSDLDKLIGVEYLVCGVREENHKRIKKKVREVLEGLHERARWGYYLESLTQKKASNSCIKIGKHGFCFTDRVMNLAEMYLKELDAKENIK